MFTPFPFTSQYSFDGSYTVTEQQVEYIFDIGNLAQASLIQFLFIFLCSLLELNCSDGAAALVLVSGRKANELGLNIIARIKGYADAAQVFNFLSCFFCN